MNRPTCGNCDGPLDIWHDEDDGRATLVCNNPRPMMTDEQFRKAWGELDGDDVARLERLYS